MLVNPEAVGEKFDPIKLEDCRKKAWELLYALKNKIEAGMKEADGHNTYKLLCSKFGVDKNWHPPKIRFGANTTKGFREVSNPDVVLQENDIFFLDIGPVFFDHEGDVGKPFTIGKDPRFEQACADCEKIYEIVGNHWRESKTSGASLYSFAEEQAQKFGWTLNLYGASGHRLGDFPHAVFHKGSLKEFSEAASANRWILEIQIRDGESKFGAFYEDLLS